MLGEMDDLLTRIQGGLASVIAGPEAATFNDCTTNDLLKALGTKVVELAKTDAYTADTDGEIARVDAQYQILKRAAQLLGRGLEHKARVDLLVAANALGLAPEGVAGKAPSSVSSI